MPDEPYQIEHTPEVQSFLDKLAEVIGVGEPAENQSTKNPNCALEAGSIKCLNAASPMCNECEWWDGIAMMEED